MCLYSIVKTGTLFPNSSGFDLQLGIDNCPLMFLFMFLLTEPFCFYWSLVSEETGSLYMKNGKQRNGKTCAVVTRKTFLRRNGCLLAWNENKKKSTWFSDIDHNPKAISIQKILHLFPFFSFSLLGSLTRRGISIINLSITHLKKFRTTSILKWISSNFDENHLWLLAKPIGSFPNARSPRFYTFIVLKGLKVMKVLRLKMLVEFLVLFNKKSMLPCSTICIVIVTDRKVQLTTFTVFALLCRVLGCVSMQ